MLGWLDGLRRWVGEQATPKGSATTQGTPSASASPTSAAPASADGQSAEERPFEVPAAPDSPQPRPDSPFTPDASVSPSEMPSAELPPVSPAFRRHPVRAFLAYISQSRPVFAAALAVVVLLLYFGIGGLLASKIDDNPAFRPAEVDLPPGGSVAVAMTSAVLNREVNEHGWTPDNPWFFPSALLDNMPAYQRGIHMAVYRFAAALEARQPADADLVRAHQALATPPERWWLGTDWPWVRTSAASQYDDAVDYIRAYNARVANGSAPLVRDAATLSMMLEHLASALLEGEEALGRHVSGGEAVEGKRLGNDEIFYAVRGEAYASMLILAGLREDFAPLIRQRQLSARWAAAARSLEATVNINPLIVTAGDPGSLLVKNHLMEQGFAVQRAREQLLALAADLRKGLPAAKQRQGAVQTRTQTRTASR